MLIFDSLVIFTLTSRFFFISLKFWSICHEFLETSEVLFTGAVIPRGSTEVLQEGHEFFLFWGSGESGGLSEKLEYIYFF